MHTRKSTVGKVFLVGAGPGDPDLLTLKAFKAIQGADSVVYDRLVSEGVLKLIPHGVPRFFAGKSCKQKAMTQEEINALLVSLARRGSTVVRLKGGDPFFFGRGGEEALELAKHGIPFEIMPGITSAQGCAAYAGIPLTHRGLATGVRYLTGHRTNGEDSALPLDLDWASLADPDTTLVVYMGLANLGVIAERLIAQGMPIYLPAAVISHGTTSRQRILLSTLSRLPAEVKDKAIESPTLIIIGRVASLAGRLGWFSGQEADKADIFTENFTKMSY